MTQKGSDKMGFSLEEQETIILYDRAHSQATIYTFEPSLKRKLKEMAKLFPDKVILESEDNGSVEYIVPKNLVSVRKPRTLSDETKEKMKSNCAKIRKRPEEDKVVTPLLQAQ